MAESKGWIVTTSGDRPVSDIAENVKETGFTVGEVLDQIGVITGSGSDDVVEKLRAIPGIADVSPEGEVNIGPPDAPVTW